MLLNLQTYFFSSLFLIPISIVNSIEDYNGIFLGVVLETSLCSVLLIGKICEPIKYGILGIRSMLFFLFLF